MRPRRGRTRSALLVALLGLAPAVLLAWTALLLVVGTVVFWDAEESYGDER